jgi:hypothetical protein
MDIAMILNTIRPNAAWSILENDYETLDWKDNSPKPTYEEISKSWQEVEVAINKTNVENLRRSAYQKEADPIFFEVQRGDATQQRWLDKIAEIKERYPYSANSQT